MDLIAVSFFVYTLGILALGIYSARYARRTSEDFFLAGRGLGAWVAALSSSASAESGWVTLGLVGTAFTTGLGALWIIPGTVAAFLFNWLLIGERLRHFAQKHGAVTLPDVLVAPFAGTRVGRWIRIVAVLIIATMLTAYVAAQLNAAGKTFHATFEWPYLSGVLAGAGIVLAYTITGGFRAVAWTDVVQAIFMVLAVVILPWAMISHMGGVTETFARLEALGDARLTDGFAGRSGLALVGFFATWFGIPLGYPGQPHILVRFMATRDHTAIRRGTVISSLWVLVLFAGAVLLGIAARAFYGELADPEQALPIAAAEFLPGALAGMMIAAILAAICSTADSQLLVSASAFSHDIYARLLGRQVDDRLQQRINRLAVLTIGLGAALIAAGEVRAVFDFVLYAWAGLGAGFGPALILLLLWPRTTGPGVLAGMLTGFITAIVWRETLHDVIYELAPAMLLAFCAVIFVSLLTSRSSHTD
ncbi:MAG: sodium/proline symporter [Gammaproteobacteria bacterium]|nr:sodium/proline symporter [Gammaproteobacteria bacterium]